MVAKTLRVKLLARIANLGKEGDIVEVSHPQARNMLIPKGLAVLVTSAEEKAEADRRKKVEANARFAIENRKTIAETLHQQVLEFELPGIGTKVFGGIAEHDILGKIASLHKIELEKKNIGLPEDKHIKTTGDHDIRIHLGADVYIRMVARVRVKEGK